jgi:hypothetical protein
MIPETCHVDFPLFTPGACGASNTVYGHVPSKKITHFDEYRDLSWPLDAPTGRMGAVEGIIRALERAGRTDLLAKIDVTGLYASSLFHDSRARRKNIIQYARRGAARGKLLRDMGSLGVAFARRAATKYLGLKPARERMSAGPAEVFAEFNGVADISELLERQARALTEQGTARPWGP